MNKLVRWYNQNRKIIWTTILTIAMVIGLIQSLNNYYKNRSKDKISSTNSTTDYVTSNYSVVTQEKINQTTSKKSYNLIDKFFEYCNNGKIENAYELLSQESRKELYPKIDDFKTKYYNKIFTEKKSYDSMLWITTSGAHTYRIEIMSDLLATGKKDSMPIVDYYTIISEGGEYKLSISGYIGNEEININKTKNNIKVSIVLKKIYMDYEIYKISIQNNTGNKLIFNTKENTDSIYIEDENKLKYIAFLNEIPDSELEILNGDTKTIEIKFNRTYKPEINIEKIVFKDISNNSKVENMEIEL